MFDVEWFLKQWIPSTGFSFGMRRRRRIEKNGYHGNALPALSLMCPRWMIFHCRSRGSSEQYRRVYFDLVIIDRASGCGREGMKEALLQMHPLPHSLFVMPLKTGTSTTRVTVEFWRRWGWSSPGGVISALTWSNHRSITRGRNKESMRI
jgi:hypothetical protein